MSETSVSDGEDSSSNSAVDGRWNVFDESGTSYLVVDSEADRKVAGPFGSAQYAGKVMDRINWPNRDALRVEQEDI